FVAGKILSSEYHIYACGKIFHAPRFRTKNLVSGWTLVRTFGLNCQSFLRSIFMLISCQCWIQSMDWYRPVCSRANKKSPLYIRMSNAMNAPVWLLHGAGLIQNTGLSESEKP
ncbi:MAG: hypothetical protein KAI39_11680, partial [Desulfobulbaceae bacterium]|nr:hypothetical protein [Desulfobulbaceae bacterium]